MNENNQKYTSLNSIESGIINLDELADVIKIQKTAGNKVVHCHGVFDLIHVGHIRHLEEARSKGDFLAVTITPDRYVNKGPDRPVFDENLRAEVLASLACVDYVAINRWPAAVETIELLSPDVYVKGPDYAESENDRTGGIDKERVAIESVGGSIEFTDDITYSSSNLINKHIAVRPEGVSRFLNGFSKKYSSNEIIKYIDNARSIRALIVGEAIIDEYVYCETMGKSGKEPVLASRQLDCERFAGGIIAIANHVAAICDEPAIFTVLGVDSDQHEFIRHKLAVNVLDKSLYQSEDPSIIVKRRFVESYPFQKLFELYVMGESDQETLSPARCELLEEIIPDYDIVIVADYGHGMLGPDEVEVLCRKSQFLAINTQINAGNLGFNTVSKYSRADFVCVSEREIRLEARNREGDLRDIITDVSNNLSCDKILITRGELGSLLYGKKEGFLEIPAFTAQIVDRVGAGDAVFAVASLCAVQKAPMDVVGFIGNVVGAEAVGIIGNRDSIQKIPLIRHLETVLK